MISRRATSMRTTRTAALMILRTLFLAFLVIFPESIGPVMAQRPTAVRSRDESVKKPAAEHDYWFIVIVFLMLAWLFGFLSGVYITKKRRRQKRRPPPI